jgi:uncharacterized UPF0160 family protein
MTKTIITHGGAFHTDEIFAVATLMLRLKGEKVTVVRTRDESLFPTADYVVDVGGVLNPEGGRFDHHQQGGAGSHSNGIPYASFGLVWKEFGIELCGGNDTVAKNIETKIVSSVDAFDNGVSISTNLHKDIYPYSIGQFFGTFLPSFSGNKEDYDTAFNACVNIAKELLEREITKALERVTLERIVEDIYQKTEDKRVIVLDKKYPWESSLVKFPEPLYVVYSNTENNNWNAKAVPADNNTLFSVRKKFPESWAGKRGEALVAETGVADAIFCHNARFIAVAESKEGILELVRQALDQK